MKRSALFYLQRRSKPSFMEHHGWEIPAWFQPPQLEAAAVRNGVGLTDVSYHAKFLSKTRPESGSWRLGSQHFLTVGDAPLDPPISATDVTNVYADVLLAGRRSREVLAKLTSVDLSDKALPNLSCAQANVAHTHAIVLREDLPDLRAYQILINREYSESVWESITHAGHEYDLCPFGLRALELLRA
jgi:glycine cleavage system aminomethyltransferase T